MKKSRYSEQQIVLILREADRGPMAEVAKRNGVSEASIYATRKRFGETASDDVKRLYRTLGTRLGFGRQYDLLRDRGWPAAAESNAG